MSITTETGLGTKDKPEDEDSLLTTESENYKCPNCGKTFTDHSEYYKHTHLHNIDGRGASLHENQSDVARGITMISDLVSEVSSIDDGELMQKMKESGISHEDAQTALTKAFESKIIVKEGGPGSGPQTGGSTGTALLPEQQAMQNIKPNYNAFEPERNPLQPKGSAPMIDSESLTHEGGPGSGPQKGADEPESADDFARSLGIHPSRMYDNQPLEKIEKEIDDLDEYMKTATPYQKDYNKDSLDIMKDYRDKRIEREGGVKAPPKRYGVPKAQEEGMGSVSGPPAGTEPTVREEKDTTFVLPADSNETIPRRDMQQKTARIVPKKDLADRELTQRELGEVSEIDSIMLNENYIQLGDVLYRPRYTSEEVWSDDMIFENKFFTSEGVGNCQFCKGAGKITVERLGLKECPDCDGTGDVQGDPMAQDPTQEPLLGEVPEVPNIQQEEVPDVTEPKKPNPFAGKETGTSSGAKKGWDTRGRGGASQDEPSTSGLKDTIDDDEPYVVYKDYGQPVASYTDYKEAVKHSDDIGGSVSDNSDEGNILYFAKGWDGQPDTHKGSKTIPPRKQLPRFTAQRDIHSMGSTDSGGIGEIPAGVQHSKKETLKHFAKIQEREKDTYETNTNDHTKQYYYQFEADDLDYFSDEELYSTVGAGSNSDLCRALDITYPGMDNRWDQLTDEDHKKLGDAFRDNPVSQTNPNYNGWVETTVTFKDYPDNYVNASNLSADDAGMGVRTSNHEVRFHNRSLTRIIDDKLDAYTGEAKLKSGYVRCSKCDQQFSSVQWALDHEKEAHGESKKKSNESTKCFACGREYETKQDLYDHMNADHQHSKESGTESKKSCKPCRKTMAHEASVSKFKSFVNSKINILQKRAKAGESVSLMYGLPTVTRQGRKIKGTLAYAGVSLNDRIYLPEELAKGDGLTLPLLLNHSSIAGAEDELDRLDDKMLEALYNEEDYEVGEVTLTWDASKLTLFYTGVVENEFFQKEIDDMDMAVSLGIYYDSDSPRICDVNCYTLIKGAEFREVSLVYHAGFPIATIEAVESQLKKRALARIAKEDVFDDIKKTGKKLEDDMGKDKLSDVIDKLNKKNEPEGGWSEEDKVEETTTGADVANSIVGVDIAEEEEDDLARGGSVDVEEIEDGTAPTIDLNDDWEGQTIVTEMFTPDNFSVRGIMGMTISNANGVERYTLDPTMNYGTNTVHFDTHDTGATIYGESLQFQPVMGTPAELTKEIESKPDIVIEDADKDAFESVKKKPRAKKRG